jgi:AcrR family transcriptional regulator
MATQRHEKLPQSGRINQKLRTRRELLRGARELMLAGEAVTVAEAAKRVGISTATSYRYFSEPASMQVEAVLEMDLGNSKALMAQLEIRLKDVDAPIDRAIRCQSLIFEHVSAHEFPFRIYIAKLYEQIVINPSENDMRNSSYTFDLMAKALEPAAKLVPDTALQEIIICATSTSSPEAYFALKDTCGLNGDAISQTGETSLRAMLTTLLDR